MCKVVCAVKPTRVEFLLKKIIVKKTFVNFVKKFVKRSVKKNFGPKILAQKNQLKKWSNSFKHRLGALIPRSEVCLSVGWSSNNYKIITKLYKTFKNVKKHYNMFQTLQKIEINSFCSSPPPPPSIMVLVIFFYPKNVLQNMFK